MNTSNASKIKHIKNQGYQVKIVHWRPVAVKHGYGTLEKTVAIAKRGVDKFQEVKETLLAEYKNLEAVDVKLLPKGGETVVALVKDGQTVVAAVAACGNKEYYNRRIQVARALGKLEKKAVAKQISI
jgi:hypothetical protein